MTNHCARCGYDWNSRKPNPLACPRCKRYLDEPWDAKKSEKKEE